MQPIIEGGYSYQNAGAPVAGTDEVQTLTIGGTPDGGTFQLEFAGYTTAPISWSATNATLIANIDAALEALPPIGAGGVAVAVGSMTAGVGTATITFSGANLAKRAQPTIAVAANALTGTSPTVEVAETTPGVNATALGAAKGAMLIDTTNGKAYINTGTAAAPTWTVTGTQS
jgi:hypothetical protein